MKDIITGGVYAVDLHGTEAYEFKGVHPALIVRMLKEEKMYYVVPLTTEKFTFNLYFFLT